jgi:hypothetical protein
VDLRNWEFNTLGSAVVGADVYVYDAVLTHPNVGTVLASTTTNSDGMWAFAGLSDVAKDVKVVYAGKTKWYKGMTRHNLGTVLSTEGPVPGLADNDPIINGSFRIWQGGTTFTSIAAVAYGPDQWKYLKVGAVVHDLLRSTDVPAISALYPRLQYSAHLDVTTADAALAAGDVCIFSQPIEGHLWAPFAGRQFTLGFWVKDTKTGLHAVAFRNSGADRSYVAEYTINAADTWEYKTVTVPASPSAGTWDYTTGLGLSIDFTLACGSTYQTTAGAWQTGNFLGTANTVNSVDNTANNFKLAGVGPLVAGAYAAPHTARSFPLDLLMAQRYFTKSFLLDTAPAQNAGVSGAIGARVTTGGAGGITSVTQRWPVLMRATPTITLYNPSAANALWRDLSAGIDCGAAPGTNLTSDSGAEIYTNQVAGNLLSDLIAYHFSATARL